MKKYILLFSLALLFSLFYPRSVNAQGQQLSSFYYYDARNQYFNAFAFQIERDCGNPNRNSTKCNLNDPLSYYPRKSFDQLISDYDTLVFLQSVQGLVNRGSPVFFVSHHDVDEKWLAELSNKDVWLQGTQKQQINILNDVINIFKNGYGIVGSVVWDVAKPFTLDLAVSVAGADNLVIVRKNSPLYSTITASFPIKVDLTASNFPSKKAGYEWLVNNYLTTGRLNPTLAYLKDGYALKPLTEGKLFYSKDQIDGWSLMSLNGVIKHKVLDFDLAPDTRIVPPDEPSQPSGEDYQTFSWILDKARSLISNNKMLNFWGFPSRKYKQDCDHNGIVDEGDFVACGEWATQKLISTKGAVLRGAGGGDMYGVDFANSSFWEWGPGVDFIPQSSPLTPQQMVDRGYLTGNPNNMDSLQVNPNKKFVLMYLGDYDFSHPLYSFPIGTYPYVWNSRNSNMPSAWGFIGESKDIIPPLYAYYAKTKSTTDYFLMPDSGNGYVNPGDIPDQFVGAWITDSASMNREVNYRSGWVLNGANWPDVASSNNNGVKIRNMYKIISPEGIFYNAPWDNDNVLLDENLAVLPMPDLSYAGKTETDAANDLKRFTNRSRQFFVFRNVFVSPEYLSQVVNQANIPNLAVVDLLTFFQLFKAQRGNKPILRMSVISENIPSSLRPGETTNIRMTVRNDGWETWPQVTHPSCDGTGTWESGCYNLGIVLQNGDIQPTGPGKLPTVNYSVRVSLDKPVHSGETIDLNYSLAAPQTEGVYTVQTDIVKEAYYWGEYLGNQPWQKKIKVTTQAQTLPGDLNHDGKVDIFDYNLLVGNFGKTGSNVADINSDGKVDIFDYNILVGNFGK